MTGGRLTAAAACVTVGVVAALLLAGGRRVSSAANGRSPVSPATATQPPAPPPGMIAFARNTGGGPFQDDTTGVTMATAGGRTISVTPGAGCCLAWSPQADALALQLHTRGRLRAVTMGPTGLPVDTLLPRASGLDLRPGAWAPDGRHLAFTAIDAEHPGRDGIYVENVPRGSLRRLTQGPRGSPQRPLAYSPDGRSLLYIEPDRRGSFGSLYVWSLDGNVTTRLGATESMCCYFGSPASWSPDGRIAFAGFRTPTGTKGGQSAVFVADPRGRHVRRVTDWGAWTTSARWSPRGSWIVFDRASSGPIHELFLIHPDGSGERTVETNTAVAGSCCAQWSPDGRYLAYEQVGAGGRVQLYDVNVDGPARPLRVTQSPSDYLSFAWIQ